jgi:hypothetical protein
MLCLIADVISVGNCYVCLDDKPNCICYVCLNDEPNDKTHYIDGTCYVYLSDEPNDNVQ